MKQVCHVLNSFCFLAWYVVVGEKGRDVGRKISVCDVIFFLAQEMESKMATLTWKGSQTSQSWSWSRTGCWVGLGNVA